MNIDEFFTRAVALLPGAVRERLDGDFPVDWRELEDAAIGAEVGDAVRARHRLPASVETLVHRLIRDVGIVPADVASGTERQGAASAWIHWVTIEPDGESYQLRNDRSGDVHPDVRPEAVAGYATLGMELATALHETVGRWIEAGEHHQATAEDERTPLVHCAVRMHAQLRAQPETVSGHTTAASLARTLEYAWNTQGVEVRTTLSGMRISTARGACAPRRSYFAPVTGHRLHACDIGEIRWFRALAERAALGVGSAGPGPGPAARETPPAPQTSGRDSRSATGGGRSGARIPRRDAGISTEGTLKFGSELTAPDPETATSELQRAASRLPGAVRRRMAETYGARVAKALARLQTPEGVDTLRATAGLDASGRSAPAPRWLAELAAALLMDTGAQTGEGRRTSSIRLDPGRQADGGYCVTEIESGAFGHLTPAGLVEQVRLSLAFAHDSWMGLTALRNAGREGEWALSEAQAGTGRLSASETETLEVARDIGQTLGRVQRTYSGARGERTASALDQATMVEAALREVGPTARTAAGWPGAAPAPSARNPEDSARVAAVAEALHGEIRGIANRLIAGWVADEQAYGESGNA